MTNKQYLANADKANRAEWKSANAEEPKMIYVKHDLKGNYMNASGSGDDKMKSDIVMSEIGKLIVHSPDKVVTLLNKHKKSKLHHGKKYSHKELVKHVTEGLHNSPGFTVDISKEIVGQGYSLSVEGDKPLDVAGILGGASGVVNGLGNLFGGKKKAAAATAAEQAKAEAAKANAQAALSNATSAAAGGKGMGDNMLLYIGLGVTAATLLCVGIWYFKFKK